MSDLFQCDTLLSLILLIAFACDNLIISVGVKVSASENPIFGLFKNNFIVFGHVSVVVFQIQYD